MATIKGKLKTKSGDVMYPETSADKVIGLGAQVIVLEENGSTTAGTWLAKTDRISSLAEGQLFLYKVAVAGASTTKLNITGSAGTALGAKNIYRYGTTKLTTQYAVGSYILLYYNGSTFTAVNDYDANSYAYVRQYQAGPAGAGTGTKYPILTRYNLTDKPSSYDTAYSRFHTDVTIDTSNGNVDAPSLSENGTALSSKYYLASNPSNFTSNVGTITGITMNGASKGTSGVVDLGTVITDVSNKADLVDGKVPSSQLPSYVDDVLEYSAKANFPATGETGKIYVDKATNLTYRWSGSAYVEISPSLALGETSSTAFAGNRGVALETAVGNLATVATSGSYNDLSDKPIFWVTYGTTTYGQITDAVSAGKFPVIKYNGITYTYSKDWGSSLGHVFGTMDANFDRWIYCKQNSTWGTGYMEVENSVNKTNALTSSSTVVQYPNAKVVYDTFQLYAKTDDIPTKVSDLDNDSDFVPSSSLATVATSGSYNDLSNKPTIPTTASQVKALPNYSLSISTSAGNPREVKFVRVNYTNFTDNFAAYFKIGAMCSHGNGSSYTFLEDIIIGVTRTGAATCTVYKQVQNTQTYTVDSHTVHFGDVYWVVDTTNKYVDFYIICGQYATMNFTPFTAIGSTTKNTSDVIQSTGSAVLYSSGTRVWDTLGNGSLYAKTTDIPTKVSQLTNDSGFNVGTVTSVRVQAGTGLSSSTSTEQSSSLNTTISIASGYKLPTTTEWNSVITNQATSLAIEGTITAYKFVVPRVGNTDSYYTSLGNELIINAGSDDGYASTSDYMRLAVNTLTFNGATGGHQFSSSTSYKNGVITYTTSANGAADLTLPTTSGTIAITDDIKVTNATVSTTGSGNAITSVSISNGQIVANKGSTFLTSHQSLSNYVTLNSAQTITAKKTITTGAGASGLDVQISGASTGTNLTSIRGGGILIIPSSTSDQVYFNSTGITKYFTHSGSSPDTYTYTYPKKTGTIALTSDAKDTLTWDGHIFNVLNNSNVELSYYGHASYTPHTGRLHFNGIFMVRNAGSGASNIFSFELSNLTSAMGWSIPYNFTKYPTVNMNYWVGKATFGAASINGDLEGHGGIVGFFNGGTGVKHICFARLYNESGGLIGPWAMASIYGVAVQVNFELFCD